ncbi:MAG: VCBS repeat-containing protein [Planctomycetota bacterium]|nr:MAG: VCBS repeat-containing protein [Planctomycetota bacterium]
MNNIILALCGVYLTAQPNTGTEIDWPQYSNNPFVISIDIPGPKDSAGGVITADLNNDGLMDYLVTVSGHVAAYAHNGTKLWLGKTDIRVGGSSENVGLPGHNGPGVQTADIDADGATEVLYLTQDSTLHVMYGLSGQEKWKTKPPIPKGAEGWEHLVVANFRGRGDGDLLLQATNADGYRTGRYLAAYTLDNLRREKYKPLWHRDDFMACAHNGARIADLDGDGKDEVLGATIVGSAGKILYRLPLKGHLDSIFVNDVRPDIPGLEVVALEEGGGNRIFLYNHKRLIWETHYQHREPQNAAIGEFDPDRPGLEIWCRSRYEKHQKPFVFDAKGKLIFHYQMDKVAPDGWTSSGVECIFTIDWTGKPKQLAAANERHKKGDVCIFDPIGGAFIRRIRQKTDRLYVVDVSGDWREEIIVLKGNRLFIYHNPEPNPRPKQPRLWKQQHYRRSKMTWNYYSP